MLLGLSTLITGFIQIRVVFASKEVIRVDNPAALLTDMSTLITVIYTNSLYQGSTENGEAKPMANPPGKPIKSSFSGPHTQGRGGLRQLGCGPAATESGRPPRTKRDLFLERGRASSPRVFRPS